MLRLADDDQSAIPPADEIAQRAIDDGDDIARRMRAKLVERLSRERFDRDDWTGEAALFAELTAIVSTSANELRDSLFDSQVAAFLESGFNAAAPVLPTLPPAGRPPVAPPPPSSLIYPGGASPRIAFPIIDLAGEALAGANVMQPADYYALGSEARRDAFTVSGGLADKTIERIAEILDETFDESGSRTKFLDKVASEFETLPISEAHLEQVYRNNVNGAYSDGGESVLSSPLIEDAFPFRAYFSIHDERVRKTHLELETSGLSGTFIYHKDDPVWTLFRPPWEWNCRCGWAPFTIRQAARYGVEVAQKWLDDGKPPFDRVEELFVAPPSFMPPTSWQRR